MTFLVSCSAVSTNLISLLYRNHRLEPKKLNATHQWAYTTDTVKYALIIKITTISITIDKHESVN